MSADNVATLPTFAGPEIILRKIPTLQGFWPEDAAVEEAEYLVDGWFPSKSAVYLYARHGSFKTFLLVHVAFCGALGWDVMGNQVRERFGSIICCGEKKARFGKRIVAWKLANNVTSNPGVFVRDGCPDLTDPDAVADFIEEVNGAKPLFEARGAPLRFIGLDTLSRALKAGNVSDATTAGDAINAIQRIIDETGCTVTSTAHVAKAEGSDTIKGAGEFGDSADAYIHLERDKGAKVVTATLKKQSDGPDGLQFGFAFQPVVVGIGRHGDIYSGAIVEAEVPEFSGTRARPPSLSADAMVIDMAISRMMDEGQTVPAPNVPGPPDNGLAVIMRALRAKAYDLGLRSGEAPEDMADLKLVSTWEERRKKAFERGLGDLVKARKVRREGTYIWPL